MPALLTVSNLPDTIPVFPLQGALLLPRARLLLNIFEPRYLSMVYDVLAGPRMIGMIQPKTPEQISPGDHPDIYPLGCAGRLTSFEETGDGRYLITLTGICRFAVAEELPLLNGYRRVKADFHDWDNDLEPPSGSGVGRENLSKALRQYLASRQLSADWDSIEKTPTADLVATIAMVCPFSPIEKQALLETRSLTERTDLIISMLEIDGAGGAAPESIN